MSSLNLIRMLQFFLFIGTDTNGAALPVFDADGRGTREIEVLF